MAMQMNTMGTTASVMEAIKGCTAVMGKVNEDMSVQEIAKMTREFQKQMMKTEMN